MQHKSKNDELRDTIAYNVKRIIDASDLIASDIAEEMGLTVRQLQRYKTGECEPTAAMLYLLCDTLNVNINEMFV